MSDNLQVVDAFKQTFQVIFSPQTDTAVVFLPSVGQDGHPPAFDEAQVAVGELHLQGELGHPDGELQRCAQVLVAEDDPGAHGAPRLLPVDEDVIAIHGHLGQIRVGSQPICMLNVRMGDTRPKHEQMIYSVVPMRLTGRCSSSRRRSKVEIFGRANKKKDEQRFLSCHVTSREHQI